MSLGICADQDRLIDIVIVQNDRDRFGTLDDMVVRDDVPSLLMMKPEPAAVGR
jgi:hypothetical protein